MIQAGLFISELLQDGITTNVTQNAPGYAVGWGALALINAGLAQSKNRSGLFYFLLSLILGPIATLIIVLLPKSTSAA
jgi:hypothetical protein